LLTNFRRSLQGFREAAYINLLRWVPKGTFSSLVGACARQTLPKRVRKPVYLTFARRAGADLSEVELPIEEYRSLDEFFVRRLRDGARPITSAPDVVVSPCDGTISEYGVARAGRLIQAKGHDYRLASLLPDADAISRFTDGTYLTIYLAPRDYHRVHFCAEGSVNGFQHIPGALFPVNAAAVKHVSGLFALNERLVTYHDSPFGEIATVMVAATGVGHMTVSYDAVEAHMPGKGRPGPRIRYSAPRPVGRGDDLGAFHLGSTVVLLFEPGRVKLEDLTVGQRIRLGQPIARRAAAKARGDAAA
jgi:phosphatidylserine decarboxylase